MLFSNKLNLHDQDKEHSLIITLSSGQLLVLSDF